MKNILTFLLLSSCAFLYSQDFTKEFKVLTLPRENISIGAEWHNNIGSNGLGLGDEDLMVRKSLNNFNLNKEFKNNLDIAVFKFLNLNLGLQKDIKIEYDSIKIYTPIDFTKINIRSGQDVIYEGIKAARILIKVENNSNNKLIADLNEKLGDLKLSYNFDPKKGITLSGDNLFLAYRVLTLGNTRIERITRPIPNPQIKTPSSISIKLKILNYEIEFNHKEYSKCVDLKNKDRCSNENINVVIYNYESSDMNGDILTKEFIIKPEEEAKYRLFERKDSEIISDSFTIFFNVITFGDYFQLDKHSTVTINRSITTFKTKKNVSAPGW